MSKHPKAGVPGTFRAIDDMERNPGIGTSKGMSIAGPNLDPLDGDTTFEGDVENDVSPTGGIDPEQRGRTNT